MNYFLKIIFLLLKQDKEDQPLFKFYKIILDYGDKFLDRVNEAGDVTMFAPSNEAWDNPELAKYLT